MSELKDDKDDKDITLTGKFVQILYTKIHFICNRAINREEREASLWSHQDRESQLNWEAHCQVRGVRQGVGRPKQPLQAQEDPHRGEATQMSNMFKVRGIRP